MTRPDDRIKKIKEQRLESPAPQRLCERCGTAFAAMLTPQAVEEGEAAQMEFIEPWCLNCVSGQRHRDYWHIRKSVHPRCRYCGRIRKLTGIWCQSCRNLNHHIEIKLILAKEHKDQNDIDRLRLYSKFPLWKKEFKDVPLP